MLKGGSLENATTPLTTTGNKGQWVYSYGTNGLLATKKDPENNQSSYTYYADNRLKDATDPLNKPRAYAYPSPVGKPGKIPDAYPPPVVPIKQFNFTEKDGFGWTYTYDTLTLAERTATDPYGKVTTSYYNFDGTLRAKTVPFNGTVKLTTFYTYDSNGNLLTETDPVDISTYTPTIDPQTVDIASLASRTPPIKTAMSYTYDTVANYYQVKTITYNRGATALTTTIDRYTEPDGQGGNWLVTKTTAPGETVGTYLISYQRQNANGTLASTTDANNKTTSYSYYPVDDTTKANGTAGMSQTVTSPDGIKLTYTAYDKNGNASEYKNTDSTNADVPVKITQVYNSQNRLTSILKESTIQPARFPANLTQYDYDKNGNRSLVIDAESNPTTYNYTYQGQLAEIIDARGKSTKFDYSGTGCTSCSSGVDKLTAVRDANHIANSQPGTVYTYDKAGRLETEADPLNKKLKYTYYDNGLLKEKFDTTAGEPGTLLGYYHTDHLGSVMAITGANKTAAQRYTYDAFGLPKVTTSFKNSYQFTGREWDRETGLYYYRARYYDPLVGRFVSRDPIGIRGGINVYAYTNNNPLTFTDPLGLSPCSGGTWSQSVGDWQLSASFGGSISYGRINYTCRSNPKLKCSGKQVCIGGGLIAGGGLSFNVCGYTYANDSSELGGWGGWNISGGEGPASTQNAFGGGGNVGVGPGFGAGFALVRCYTTDLKCTDPCTGK